MRPSHPLSSSCVTYSHNSQTHHRPKVLSTFSASRHAQARLVRLTRRTDTLRPHIKPHLRQILSMLSLGSVVRLSTSSEKPVQFPLMLSSRSFISVPGFGYSFHSLPPPGTDPRSADKTDNELTRAFANIFSTERQFSILSILAIWFPFLRRLVRRSF
jgi:hypothetical protein